MIISEDRTLTWKSDDLDYHSYEIQLSDGKYINGGQSDTSNANAMDAVGILMEDFGNIILDGTSSGGSNAGFALLQETDKRNKFITEASGSLVVEDFSTSSAIDLILLVLQYSFI